MCNGVTNIQTSIILDYCPNKSIEYKIGQASDIDPKKKKTI
jgi:hypothetical protein